MSSLLLPIIEDDLHCFVDGEVDAERHAAILAHLAIAPAEAARVEAWRQQNILVRAAFSQVTLEPVPMNLSFSFAPRLISLPPLASAGNLGRGADARRLWRRSLAFTLTAFVAGVCIALAANFSIKKYGEFTSRAVTEAASEHGPALARLATSALHHSHAAEAGPRFALNRPGAIAPALAILPVLQHEGLRLLRGEVRGEASEPANCLDFADAAGSPVVLCVAAAKAPADPNFRGLAVVATNSVYWRESASLYALAAPLPNDRLVALARRIHAALAAR